MLKKYTLIFLIVTNEICLLKKTIKYMEIFLHLRLLGLTLLSGENYNFKLLITKALKQSSPSKIGVNADFPLMDSLLSTICMQSMNPFFSSSWTTLVIPRFLRSVGLGWVVVALLFTIKHCDRGLLNSASK